MYGIRRFQFVIAVLGMILGGCFGETKPYMCACNNTDMMTTRIDEVTEKLGLMKRKFQDSLVKCDLVSECKCFVLVARDYLSKAAAQNLCANIGGKLADIDTKKQFNDLLAYGPKHNFWGNLWTAMRYVNKQLKFSNGKNLPYVGWHGAGTWPLTDVKRSEIAIAIRHKSTSTNKGMINVLLSDKMPGYLCEIN